MTYQKGDYVIHPDEGLCRVLSSEKRVMPNRLVEGQKLHLDPVRDSPHTFSGVPSKNVTTPDRITLQPWGLLEGVEEDDYVMNRGSRPCILKQEALEGEVRPLIEHIDTTGWKRGHIHPSHLRLMTPLELLDHDIIDELPSPRPSDCCGAHTEAVGDVTQHYECVLCGEAAMTEEGEEPTPACPSCNRATLHVRYSRKVVGDVVGVDDQGRPVVDTEAGADERWTEWTCECGFREEEVG